MRATVSKILILRLQQNYIFHHTSYYMLQKICLNHAIDEIQIVCAVVVVVVVVAVVIVVVVVVVVVVMLVVVVVVVEMGWW